MAGRYVLVDYWIDGYAEGEDVVPVPAPAVASGGGGKYARRPRLLPPRREYAIETTGGLRFGGTAEVVFASAAASGPSQSIDDIAQRAAYQEFRRKLEIERDDLELLTEL